LTPKAILFDLFGPGTWGTGGNLVASALLGAGGLLLAWITHKLGILSKLMDRVGRILAAWWAKHHGPHAVAQHLEALRRHEEDKQRGPS
jgi:hypothetical protein